MKHLLDRIALFWSSPTSKTAIPFSWDMQTPGDPLRYQPCFTPNCSFSSICITASVALHTGRHPAHHLGHLLLSSASSSSSPLAIVLGRAKRGGGPDGKLSHLGFETKCCGGIHHPAGSFFGSQNRHGDHTRESRIHQRMNYKMHNITTTYIIIHSSLRTIQPQNVMYGNTNPGHNHTQYKIVQWHDRWRPHSSQWPKPAYQLQPAPYHLVSELDDSVSLQLPPGLCPG